MVAGPPSVPGVVGTLVPPGSPHLETLLREAGDRAVVLKFKREGCPACASTIAPLASAAAAYSDRAIFVTVDYRQLKAFCRSAAIKVVPCAHVYVGGQLSETLALGPSAWDSFVARLERLLGAPETDVLSAEAPEAADARSVTGIDMYL